MANVNKLIEIIYGSNPTDDDLRAIIDRLSERLPKPVEPTAPMVDTESARSDEPKVSKSSKRSQS